MHRLQTSQKIIFAIGLFFFPIFAWSTDCGDKNDVIDYLLGRGVVASINRNVPEGMLNEFKGLHNKRAENVSVEIWPGKHVLLQSYYTLNGNSSYREINYCGMDVFSFVANIYRGYYPASNAIAFFNANLGANIKQRTLIQMYPNGSTMDFAISNRLVERGAKSKIIDGIMVGWTRSGDVEVVDVNSGNQERQSITCQKHFDFMLSYIAINDVVGKELNVELRSKKTNGTSVQQLLPGVDVILKAKYDNNGLLKNSSTWLCGQEVIRKDWTGNGIFTEVRRMLPGGHIAVMKYTERNMPLEYSRYKLINGKEVQDGLYLRWVPDKDILETQSFYVNGEERIPPPQY